MCPVEDAATDPNCEETIQAFMRVKQFHALPYAAKMQERMLQAAGILDNEALLYELERVFAEYQVENMKSGG